MSADIKKPVVIEAVRAWALAGKSGMYAVRLTKACAIAHADTGDEIIPVMIVPITEDK